MLHGQAYTFTACDYKCVCVFVMHAVIMHMRLNPRTRIDLVIAIIELRMHA